MLYFNTDEDIKSEIESFPTEEKIPAFKGRKYPLEYLTSREFELLLYFIFKSEIGNGLHVDVYDSVTLMKGVAEKGRDVILQRKGKNVGVIQCKRFVDLIQKPQLAREIIKFLLHAIQEPSLIDDIENFTYYFIALSGFNDRALELLSDFNTAIFREQLESWVDLVLKENESLKFETFEEVEEKLRLFLSKIKIKHFNGSDLDQKLKINKDIVPIFFEVEMVASESMLNEMFKKFLGFKSDEDIEKLREKLKDIPKENRMIMGFFSIYGFPEEFYKKIVKDKMLFYRIAELKSEFNQRFIDFLNETIRKQHLLHVAGLSNISPFTKQVVVPYLFNKYALLFQEQETGKVLDDIIKKRNSELLINKLQTLEDIKKHLLKTGEEVINNDYSNFAGDENLIKLKMDLSQFIHKEFKNVEEMEKRFDSDMIFLKPIIEKIEETVRQIMPSNPTIIIENSNILDSITDFRKLMDNAARFNS